MTGAVERSFLFLQGPPGPFFAELAKGLVAAGHRCARINFNGGDWLDWRGPAMNFTGGIAAWPAYLAVALEREAITDIVLFGDCRPMHEIAREIAHSSGVTVHVFEEGYIRPDWVTLERGGVNGHSSLPRNPEDYLALAASLPAVPQYPSIPSSFRRRAIEASVYFFGVWALAIFFRRHRSHRPYSVTAEFTGWFVRMLLRPVSRMRSALALRQLTGKRYFVVPLQLDSDHQIRTHSPFRGMADAVESILASFAARAPAESVLLVKEHPLDNGLRPWRRIVRQAAARHGIRERVIFIEHGDIPALVGAAAGVVTVNSTTGTFALAAGIPVAVLGQAVYDLKGVTHQGHLDDFWRQPGKPQVEIYEAFRRVLAQRCLLRGGFSSLAGRAHLLPAAIERLGGSQKRAAETSSSEPLWAA